MKALLITIIVLVSINFSGCAVPSIVKNITDSVLEGKAFHEAQQQSAVEFLTNYIAANNSENKALIKSMTTPEFVSENKYLGLIIKPVGEPRALVEDNIAVVLFSFTSMKEPKHPHCGTSSFQLVKNNNDWKLAHITWSVEQTDCQSSSL